MQMTVPKTPEERKAFEEFVEKRKKRIREMNKEIIEFNKTADKVDGVEMRLIELDSWPYV